MTIARLASLALVSAIVVACSDEPQRAGPGSAAQAQTGDACTNAANAARAKVVAAIDANLACTKDDDCTNVAIATSCFDSCAGAVAKSGVAAVDAAKSSADANECKAFTCTLLRPPCVPSEAPTCQAGRCT